MSKPLPKRTSGMHPAQPAVIAMRKKMNSITENTLPLLDEATAALERAISSAPPTTERPASPMPPPQSVPVFVDDREITPVPTTRPSPSNVAREKFVVEPDPFAEKKEEEEKGE